MELRSCVFVPSYVCLGLEEYVWVHFGTFLKTKEPFLFVFNIVLKNCDLVASKSCYNYCALEIVICKASDFGSLEEK